MGWGGRTGTCTQSSSGAAGRFRQAECYGTVSVNGPRYEQRIDEKYINHSKGANSYRVETFRSPSTLPGENGQQLRCYFVAWTVDRNGTGPAGIDVDGMVLGLFV
jgi:hypothetical protein